ncbi:MAG: ABC transporter substrate-binding protein [Candidatus Dormibacteraceae bacterium]
MFRPNAILRSAFGLVAALVLAACGGSPSAATTPGQPTALTASYSELVPDEWGPWAAADGGYFTKNNLDVTLTSISSATGVAALLSNQTQIAQLGGSEVLSAAASGGDLVIVANLVPVYPYVFLTQPNITSPNQLKGTKIGISKKGGSADIATRAALQSMGLDATKDVTIVETGSSSNRVAALKSGAIQGGVSQPPESTLLVKQGFHVLLDMASKKIPAANTVVATTGAYLKGHRAVVQAYVDALVQALKRLRTDETFADQVLMKWEKLSDTSTLGDTYQFYTQEVFPQYPFPRAAQYQPAIDTLKSSNPKVTSLDLTKLLDASFVQSASDRKLGA